VVVPFRYEPTGRYPNSHRPLRSITVSRYNKLQNCFLFLLFRSLAPFPRPLVDRRAVPRCRHGSPGVASSSVPFFSLRKVFLNQVFFKLCKNFQRSQPPTSLFSRSSLPSPGAYRIYSSLPRELVLNSNQWSSLFLSVHQFGAPSTSLVTGRWPLLNVLTTMPVPSQRRVVSSISISFLMIDRHPPSSRNRFICESAFPCGSLFFAFG